MESLVRQDIPDQETQMKRNAGRPYVRPTGPSTTLTLRISADLKNKLIDQADAVDLTLTAYLETLILRDSAS